MSEFSSSLPEFSRLSTHKFLADSSADFYFPCNVPIGCNRVYCSTFLGPIIYSEISMPRFRFCQLETLEGRCMLSLTAFEQEVNNNTSNANSFSLDASDGRATLVGSLSPTDARDYFRFSPTGDLTRTLAFSVAPSVPPGPRPKLEIQDRLGNTIAETDPDHGINSGTVVLTLGETYFVRMDMEDDISATIPYQASLNLPPVTHAFADSAATVEDAPAVTIDVLANDIGMNPEDPVTLVSVSTSGLLGNVSLAPNGTSVLYSVGTFPGLEIGTTATETFSYVMSYAGGTRQASGVVTITISGVNHPPAAVDDDWSVSEDAAPSVIPVLDNDQDVDIGDSRRVVSVQSNGIAGTVQIASGGSGIMFYPGSTYQSMIVGQATVQTITYTMMDHAGAVSSATLTLRVLGANDAPVAIGNSARISEDDRSYFLDVLPDDTDLDAGDTLSVVSYDGSGTPGGYYFVCVCAGGACVAFWYPGTPGISGTVEIAPGGTGLLYTPPASFQDLTAGQTATEAFRYTVRDRAGLESTTTVIVTVEGRNERVLQIPAEKVVTPRNNPGQSGRPSNATEPDSADLRSHSRSVHAATFVPTRESLASLAQDAELPSANVDNSTFSRRRSTIDAIFSADVWDGWRAAETSFRSTNHRR